jgi:hypothetical protein
MTASQFSARERDVKSRKAATDAHGFARIKEKGNEKQKES